MEPNKEDTFRILVATDIHLGYAEEDNVRGNDTFDTLEEILQIGTAEEVDFVLLGGDLFHQAQPSPYCIHKCMELFKKYCLGDRPISIEYLSDQAENFSQSTMPVVNYEDPNLNVSLPVFSIHGNHDDPTGHKSTSCLDLLSTSGLVNYFGRCNNYDLVKISPILLKKGETQLALYGLSHIRDERLGRLFVDGKVKMLSPNPKEDWFHLLVLHQNRAARGSKNFIPDHSLPSFLDLVIWGHEHDCRIEAENVSNGVYISQPGSSVATSLCAGEAIPKKVGILTIYKTNFKIEPIELKTVRPFIFKEIILDKMIPEDDEYNDDPSKISKKIVTTTIEDMLQQAKDMGHIPKVSDKPLIRLIVRNKNEKHIFNTIRFGQMFFDKVANPENMVKFQSIKDPVRKNKTDAFDNAHINMEGPVLADRVEDLVTQFFSQQEGTLDLFPLNSLNEAVKKFIDSNDSNAIKDVTNTFQNEVLEYLIKEGPDEENSERYIDRFKKNMEKDSLKFVEKILNNTNRNTVPIVDDNSDDGPTITIDDDDDDDELNASSSSNKPARGKGSRGRRGARAPRRTGRGRKAS